MTVVVIVLVAVIVVAVAAVFVLREAGRQATRPIEPTFSLDEAYEWVVEELPDEVAATLTPADVRRILALQVEYLRAEGVARMMEPGTRRREAGGDEVVIGGGDLEAFIIERAAADGEEFIPEQIEAVLATQLRYLTEIGAAAPVAPDAEDVAGPAAPAESDGPDADGGDGPPGRGR